MKTRRMIAAMVLGTSLMIAQAGAAIAAGGHTSRINVTSTGEQATEFRSEVAAVTSGARYVLFTSAAPNLTPGDANETWDVFLRDRLTATTTLISVSRSGRPADSSSYGTAVTSDGRYVMFTSLASDLVPGTTGDNHFDVYLRDRWTRSTTRVSVSSMGARANGATYGNAMSPDGRYVAFASDASNLVPGDTNDAMDVFVRDRIRNTTSRVSVSDTATQGNAGSYEVVVGADGRYVAFTSDASNLVPGDTNDAMDVFVRDRIRNTTSRVSVSDTGRQANAGSRHVSLSADGRHVAFTSDAGNLVPADSNNDSDVFVRDLVRRGTSRVSVAGAGAQAAGDSYDPSISENGRYVAFTSDAADLVSADTNANGDVFVRDRWTNITNRASVSSTGIQGNEYSAGPTMSPDGHHVAFDSIATNLVPDDTNNVGDVFLRRLR